MGGPSCEGSRTVMSVFGDKLDRLVETIDVVTQADFLALTAALKDGSGRLAVAIGSGGSAVAAEFLAHCRATLGYGPTLVETPMEFVLDLGDHKGHDIWLFTAGAENPDIAAALHAALASCAASIRMVTCCAGGASAIRAAESPRCTVHVIPVAVPKDGFLATHSLVAVILALLLASERLGGYHALEAEREEFIVQAGRALSREARERCRADCERFVGLETLILLFDPRLKTIATLLDTSIWEAALPAVQTTDFRNFAHGRHVWLARRPKGTGVLALASRESQGVWDALDALIPADLPRMATCFSGIGRRRVALGVVEGLVLIEALGDLFGVDPGSPGTGSFARPIYNDPSLLTLASGLSPAVRHKWAAVLRHDDPVDTDRTISQCAAAFRSRMTTARFGGLVLDYDGTVVATDARLLPPAQEIVDELVRLVDGGVAVAFATGRGGSAGETLRQVLPERIHRSVTIGYYNGAHIRTLDIDIDHDQPDQDPDIVAIADWVSAEGLLRDGKPVKLGRVQLTIDYADLVAKAEFTSAAASREPIASGRLRILSSQHSFDVMKCDTTKLLVVRTLAERLGNSDVAILTIGDSGGPGGNDFELLGGPYSVSVDRVCGRPDGSWSMFGAGVGGPVALLRLLKGIRIEATSGARLDAAMFSNGGL